MFYLLLAVFIIFVIGCLLGSYQVQARGRLVKRTWHIQIRLMCAGKIFGLHWSDCSDRPRTVHFILFWIPFSFSPGSGKRQKKNELKQKGIVSIIRRGKQLKRMVPLTTQIRHLVHVRSCQVQGETHFNPAITGLIYIFTQIMNFFDITPQIQLQPCFFPGDSSVSGIIDLQFSGLSLFILALKEWRTWRTMSKA
jgi:hypothetical protein